MTPPICFHLLPGVYDDAWVDWASRAAPWAKVCSASAIARAAANGAKVYYRPCYLPTDDGEGDCADGTLWAQKVIAAVETAGGHWPDAIGFRNELHATVANAEQYMAYRAALRAAGYKGIVALGSFSVGTPDWPDYSAMLAVQPDALEVHEYWDLTVAGSPDLALRHVEAIRRGVLPATMPLFVGECGSDQLKLQDPQDRRGWNDRGKLTDWQEAANIAAYQAACAPSVVACFVFADGVPTNGWEDFATRGTVIEPTIRKTWATTIPKGGTMTDYAPAVWAPSPNFWPGRNGAAIRAIVLHATAGPGAVSWFGNPASQVSAHYVIEEDGTVTQCVAEADSAWHAGEVTANSAYAGGDNPNHWTIGIEHTRDTTNTSPITGPQLAASLALVRDILHRHGPLSFILHDQIDMGRTCPGPGFPLFAFQALSAHPAPPTVALAIPLDNQLTSDGPNKYNECGPGCMRMICDYLGIDQGESIDAIDADETGDEQYVGYTTTNQMVAWFTARGVPAVQSQPKGTAAAIRANLARGWPCVYLGVWDRAALTGGHFEVPVAAGPDGITFNNPYGAIVETLSDADVDRYSRGWLVTVQKVRQPTVDETLKAAAVARFAALGVQPNQDGALFKAYARMVGAWLAGGQDSVLDPTPALRPEAVTLDGQHAYLLLDSFRALHWRKDTGLVYQAEAKELPGIFKTCGWPWPVAS